MNTIDSVVNANMERLQQNAYPGRGIVLGMTPDGGHLVQVYWIMGRSGNSRNRIFAVENSFVKTQAFDETKVEDPSLIIYYPARDFQDCHIITNGDQTDTIYQSLQKGATFEVALESRCFEPDAPNFTPRISGIMAPKDAKYAYQLAIIKSIANNPDHCTHQFFNYQAAMPGIGHCIHTYAGDGNPLPSFIGEPYAVKIANDLETIADLYWQLLNAQNKISLLVKMIDVNTRQTRLKLFNKHLGD